MTQSRSVFDRQELSTLQHDHVMIQKKQLFPVLTLRWLIALFFCELVSNIRQNHSVIQVWETLGV